MNVDTSVVPVVDVLPAVGYQKFQQAEAVGNVNFKFIGT